MFHLKTLIQYIILYFYAWIIFGSAIDLESTTWSKTDPQVLDSKYVYMYSLQVDRRKNMFGGFSVLYLQKERSEKLLCERSWWINNEDDYSFLFVQNDPSS